MRLARAKRPASDAFRAAERASPEGAPRSSAAVLEPTPEGARSQAGESGEADRGAAAMSSGVSSETAIDSPDARRECQHTESVQPWTTFSHREGPVSIDVSLDSWWDAPNPEP